jgi:hypothetical protein
MNNLSPLGWVLIACLAGIIISLNLGLLVSLRRKPSQANKPSNVFSKMGQTIQHPWEKEDQQLHELAQCTKRLKGNGDKEEEEKKISNPNR